MRWCRRLLRVPWTAKSNQSVLKEINPEYSLQGLMLKLKLHYFGHLMWREDSLEKTLMLGKVEGRRGWQRMRRLDSITDSMDINFSKLWERVKDREATVHGVAKSWTEPSNWTTTTSVIQHRVHDPSKTVGSPRFDHMEVERTLMWWKPLYPESSLVPPPVSPVMWTNKTTFCLTMQHFFSPK